MTDPSREDPPASGAARSERRAAERLPVAWAVDCQTEDTFLYASIRDISKLGIFVATLEPLAVGTRVTLRFSLPGGGDEFSLMGEVQWVNPVRLLAENRNPGMGVAFVDLSSSDRERLVDVVRTIAYLRGSLN